MSGKMAVLSEGFVWTSEVNIGKRASCGRLAILSVKLGYKREGQWGRTQQDTNIYVVLATRRRSVLLFRSLVSYPRVHRRTSPLGYGSSGALRRRAPVHGIVPRAIIVSPLLSAWIGLWESRVRGLGVGEVR